MEATAYLRVEGCIMVRNAKDSGCYCMLFECLGLSFSQAIVNEMKATALFKVREPYVFKRAIT